METSPGQFQVLYVSDIDHITREEHLWQAFSPWAPGIRSIKLIRDAGRAYTMLHAYINFTNNKDASDALASVQPLFINSSYCKVMPFDRGMLTRPRRLDAMAGSGIFIKNLDVHVTASMLWGFFMGFGTIIGCRIAIDELGVPRGFAYVTFETQEQAAAAIEGMDGQFIGRRRVFVSLNLPKSQRSTRIFIKLKGDLAKLNLEESDLEEAFADYESLESVTIPRNYSTGQLKGVAFAVFKDQADALRATKEIEKISDVPVIIELASGGNHRTFGNNSLESRDGTPYNNTTFNGSTNNIRTTSNNSENHNQKSGENGSSSAKNSSANSSNSSSNSSSANSNTTTKSATDSPSLPTSSKSTSDDNNSGATNSGTSSTGQTSATSSGPYNSTLATNTTSNVTENPTINNTNLFVRPLPSDVGEAELQEMFSPFGTISSVKLMVDHEGKSRGFGFVSFDNVESATKAVVELNGTNKWGQPLFVAPAQSRRKPHPQLNLNMSMPHSLPHGTHAHGHGHSHGHGPHMMPPAMGQHFAGVYYIPMEYAFDYNPYASPGFPMNHPGAMHPARPLPLPVAPMHQESMSVEELGEMLYPHVVQHSLVGGDLDVASRVTGLLLQQPENDIITWLETPVLLNIKIQQVYESCKEWIEQSKQKQKS